jgi:DNA-binding CsgD family transcriptional regulator
VTGTSKRHAQCFVERLGLLRGLRNRNPITAACPFLTDRENRIALGVIDGLTDRAIADALGISYWTVRTHLEHIFRKLEVKNRAALVARLHREV